LRGGDDGFGGSLEEKRKKMEEAEIKRVRERRLWEREMDEVIDKALRYEKCVR